MRQFLRHVFVPHWGNDYKPFFFREASVATLLSIAVTISLLSIAGSLLVTKTNLLASIQSAFLVDLTNQERYVHGLPNLKSNPRLQRAAQLKANHMAEKSYFAHTSPDGVDPWHWFKQVGYEYHYAGENLAINFINSEDVSDAWMDSPDHRANILHEKFTEIGIAHARGMYNGQETNFIVQMFGRERGAAPPPPAVVIAEPEPTPTLQELAVTAPTNGWVAEGFIASADPSIESLSINDPIIVTAGNELNVRSAPEANIIAKEPTGSQGVIVAGPHKIGSHVWWNVAFGIEPIAVAPSVTEPPIPQAEIMVERELFAMVEGIQEDNTSTTTSAPLERISPTQWLAQVLANPAHTTNGLYLILLGFITLALIIMVVIEHRHQHTRNVVYGVSLLGVIMLLFYVNQVVLQAQPLIA